MVLTVSEIIEKRNRQVRQGYLISIEAQLRRELSNPRYVNVSKYFFADFSCQYQIQST